MILKTTDLQGWNNYTLVVFLH